MIWYDEGKWGVTFAYTCKGSSAMSKGLMWAVPAFFLAVSLNLATSGGFSGISNSVTDDVESVQKGYASENGLTEILKGYSVALAFLLVFRTQVAYSRLWDGVSHLQNIRSSWVNVASCCFAFCSRQPEKDKDCRKFQNYLARLVSLMYSTALQSVCEMGEDSECFQIMSLDGVEPSCIKWMEEQEHKPEIIMQWIQKAVVEAHREGIIDIAAPILTRVFQGLDQGLLELAAAQKMFKVPFPFPYAQMISIMLQCHTVGVIFIAGIYIDSAVGAGIMAFMVVMTYWTLNYVAMEIEFPFGDDANDLPMHEIGVELNERLWILSHEMMHRAPEFIDPDEDDDFSSRKRISRMSAKGKLDRPEYYTSKQSNRPPIEPRNDEIVTTVGNPTTTTTTTLNDLEEKYVKSVPSEHPRQMGQVLQSPLSDPVPAASPPTASNPDPAVSLAAAEKRKKAKKLNPAGVMMANKAINNMRSPRSPDNVLPYSPEQRLIQIPVPQSNSTAAATKNEAICPSPPSGQPLKLLKTNTTKA